MSARVLGEIQPGDVHAVEMEVLAEFIDTLPEGSLRDFLEHLRIGLHEGRTMVLMAIHPPE